MTQYIIRVTDITERRTFDIEQREFDTIEDCQKRAFVFWAQCYPLTKDDTKTTILMKADPLEQIWSMSCFRLGVDGPWVYPEDLEEMSIL